MRGSGVERFGIVVRVRARRREEAEREREREREKGERECGHDVLDDRQRGRQREGGDSQAREKGRVNGDLRARAAASTTT